jgi:type IV secretion system protein VirB2
MEKSIIKPAINHVKAWFREEQNLWTLFIILLLALMTIAPVNAAGLPWEDPLKTIMQSLCGPVAKFSAVIAIVITGLLIAFGEMKGVFSVMIRVVFGLSIALLAVQWLGTLGLGSSLSVSC